MTSDKQMHMVRSLVGNACKGVIFLFIFIYEGIGINQCAHL